MPRFLQFIIFSLYLDSMKKRVLIIEDTEFMQLMLKNLFSGEGFEVTAVASNAIDGIKAFEEYKPDLVTLDMIMPGENGLKALKEILEIDKQAKILVISSKAQRKKYGYKALEMGARGLLLKPFRPSDFRETVNKILLSNDG